MIMSTRFKWRKDFSENVNKIRAITDIEIDRGGQKFDFTG